MVKGTWPIEVASKVKVVALDKTGTLTAGSLVLEEIILLDNGYSEEELLSYSASLEVFQATQ